MRLLKDLEALQILELTFRSELQSSWMTRPRYWKLETGSTGGWLGKRWMGTGCAERLAGRTAMVLVFE